MTKLLPKFGGLIFSRTRTNTVYVCGGTHSVNVRNDWVIAQKFHNFAIVDDNVIQSINQSIYSVAGSKPMHRNTLGYNTIKNNES